MPPTVIDAVPWLGPSLMRLLAQKNCGDLLVFARRLGLRVVNFQSELGGHGGLYVEEQTAFIVAPAQVAAARRGGVDLDRIDRAADLYPLFRSYSTGREQP